MPYQKEKPKTQAKTFSYNFMTNELVPSKAGQPASNPFKKTKDGHVIVRFMSAKQKDNSTDSMYLSPQNEQLLRDWGAKINYETYSKVAKSRYQSLVNELSRATHIEDQQRSVEKLIELINIVEENKQLPENELGTQITKSLLGYEKQRALERTERSPPRRAGAKEKPRVEQAPVISQTHKELIKAQFGSSSSSSSSGSGSYGAPPPYMTPLDLTRDPSAEIRKGLFSNVETSISQNEGAIVEAKKSSRQPSRQPSRMNTPARQEPTEPTEQKGTTVADDLFNEYGTLTIGGNPYDPRQPTDMTKFQDSGGAANDVYDEKLVKQPKQTSQPDAINTDSDVVSDLLTGLATDNETMRPNKYGTEINKQEDKQREAAIRSVGYYERQRTILDRNPAITEGGGNDVYGVGKGSQTDVELLGSDYAPASYDVYNPQSMKRSVERSVTAGGGDRITVSLSGIPLDDDNVRRTARNSGLSDVGLTPAEIVAFVNGERNERGGRLSERVGRGMMDTAVSMGSAGSGIASQIGGLIDEQRNGSGRDRSQEGLYGGDDSPFGGGDGFGQDLTNPRTLNERFSNLGMRRQGDKVDKYINMKNKGMMYSNLMGKGVSDPSIQSIRDRKDDYIQPDRKHKGNSVNLIRQSNATAIRLNNMYMP